MQYFDGMCMLLGLISKIIELIQMKYSKDELAEAARTVREDALYFRGLDWENATSEWGHVATPWRENYPDCWDDLFEGMEH